MLEKKTINKSNMHYNSAIHNRIIQWSIEYNIQFSIVLITITNVIGSNYIINSIDNKALGS